jgi:ureidoacrylate peracid hydrolase
MPGVAGADPMLSRILSPGWAAVLVVDVQNDFCHERGAMGRLGFEMGPIQSSVGALSRLLEAARLTEVPVIFIATQHSPATNSQAWLTRGSRRGGEICAVGSWGAEFYKVAPAAGESMIIKHRYSGFIGTDLDLVLRARERRSALLKTANYSDDTR